MHNASCRQNVVSLKMKPCQVGLIVLVWIQVGLLCCHEPKLTEVKVKTLQGLKQLL